MVSWSDARLTELSRAQLEQVTSTAIHGLLEARDLNSNRQKQDSLILAFVTGIAFTCLAVFVGMNLH
jgi:hypothetical protein